jgi:hypothetical protein
MLKVNRGGCQLTRLDPRSMADADMRERSDLQRLIYANSSQFFKDECRDDLFVLNEEVSPSDFVADRIDLLAIDSYGTTVIIELKRGSDKLQLLQALSYAAMVSGLTWKEVESKAAPERLQALRQFLADNGLDEDDEEGQLGLNLSQRVILIAESYDYEVLCTAQWLTDKWGLNITCYSVALARDVASGTDYLSAVQLFPAKPLAAYARQRGSQRGQVTNEPKTLERRLATSENQAISSFFSELLLQNPRRNRRGTSVVFPSTGKIRYRISPRKQYARVSQSGRFEGDEQLWGDLSEGPAKAVKGGRNLVFHLNTDSDIQKFHHFLETGLANVEWRGAGAESENDDDENDADE